MFDRKTWDLREPIARKIVNLLADEGLRQHEALEVLEVVKEDLQVMRIHKEDAESIRGLRNFHPSKAGD